MRTAEIAYNAYCRSTGGRAFNGDKLPAFRQTPERIQAAWGAAIDAVLLDATLIEVDAETIWEARAAAEETGNLALVHFLRRIEGRKKALIPLRLWEEIHDARHQALLAALEAFDPENPCGTL